MNPAKSTGTVTGTRAAAPAQAKRVKAPAKPPGKAPARAAKKAAKPRKAAPLTAADYAAAGIPIDYAEQAEAPATRRAHTGDVDRFIEWGGTIPANVEMLETYLSAHAETHKAATLTRWLASISVAHRRAGVENPCRHQKVRDVLNGIKRVHGVKQRKVSPALHQDVLKMTKGQPKGLVGLRNRALLLVGFSGALRRSELGNLQVSGLLFEAKGVTLNLGPTKTDPTGRSSEVAIPRATVKERCPVRALQEWLKAANITAGAVFPKISAHGTIGKKGLTGVSIANIIKASANAAGLHDQELPLGAKERIYSGHSLRAGLVTSAVRENKPYHKIKQQTRHRSDATLAGYVRDEDKFRDNAADLSRSRKR